MFSKFEIDKFRRILNDMENRKEITKDTVNTYISCIRVLDKNCKDIKPNSIKDFLQVHLKTKEGFYKYLAAIRMYEDKVLNKPRAVLYGEPETILYRRFKNKINTDDKIVDLSIDTINRKINALRNKKLKYALRLQLKSGLRISEISKLEKDDISFEDGKMFITVKEGKGRKYRFVEVLEDNYLYENLQGYIEKCPDKKLFYSRDYLRYKSREIGIETHDLRRVNARQRLEYEMAKGKTRLDAKEIVKEQLGQEKIRITNIYLRYKIKK